MRQGYPDSNSFVKFYLTLLRRPATHLGASSDRQVPRGPDRPGADRWSFAGCEVIQAGPDLPPDVNNVETDLVDGVGSPFTWAVSVGSPVRRPDLRLGCGRVDQ